MMDVENLYHLFMFSIIVFLLDGSFFLYQVVRFGFLYVINMSQKVVWINVFIFIKKGLLTLNNKKNGLSFDWQRNGLKTKILVLFDKVN